MTCFIGFMRARQVLLNGKDKFDPSYNLSFADVASDSCSKPSFIQLTQKGSKTEPFRKGVSIIIGSRLCPKEALFKFLMLWGNKDWPLFLQEDGSPLTKPLFIQVREEALKSAGYHEVGKYAGNSFGAGATTTAAMGIPGFIDKHVRQMGEFGIFALYQNSNTRASVLARCLKVHVHYLCHGLIFLSWLVFLYLVLLTDGVVRCTIVCPH